MEKRKHILSMLLLVASCLFSNSAFAQTVESVEVDGIYYNLFLRDKTAEVTINPNDNKYSGEINIPGKITYNNVAFSVVSIGDNAFDDCMFLTSIAIPNSVTTIGEYAFRECYCLDAVIIPNSVTSINAGAFASCTGLTSLIIPNSVTSIEGGAFKDCAGLTTVTIGNSVTDISNNAFNECIGLKKVIVSDIAAWCNISFWGSKANPLYYAGHLYSDETTEITNLIIPNSVTSIGDYAFYGCSNFTSVTIPNSVTSIGRSAFSGCSGLTSVTIPNSVTSIGWAAFSSCSGLTSVTIPNSVTSIGERAFIGCSGLISVTIPNSVTSIENYTFNGCSGLTSVTIPNSVTSIGEWAFSGCSGLTSVTIPNSVTSIENYTFNGCSGLTSVNIGNSVESIAYSAFGNCADLTDVYCYAEKVPSTNSDAFAYSHIENATLHVPAASIEQYKTTTPWSNFGTFLLLDESVPDRIQIDGIYYTLFVDSKTAEVTKNPDDNYIGKINIPEKISYNGVTYSVTSIGEGAFYDCSGLTSVTIPNSVTSIGAGAFEDCLGLTSITIPNSVTSIGEYAFCECGGLTSVTIGNSVTSIGQYAFAACSGLTSVNIGNSVKNIGEKAFAYCAELIDVYCYAESVPTTQSEAFYDSHIENATLHVPAASIEQYKTTTPWSNFGTFLLLDESIPDRIQIDGIYYTLFVDSKTAEVTKNPDDNYIGIINIPEKISYNDVTYSVTSIGKSAFESCSGLTSVTIPNSVTSIGWAAFCECVDLTSITIPNSVTSIGREAFCECVDLTSITIPNSVTSIGEEAFCVCFGLTTINVEAGNTVYDSRDNCNAIIETATNTLITGCKNTTISTSVTNIENWAFAYCEGLTSVIIPNSVISIGEGAFSGCSGLTSVTIPNSVTSIGEYAFCECGGLTSVNIGNSVKNIGSEAFADCAELTDVYCYAEKVPSTNSDAFAESYTEYATLHVPAASIEQYKATAPWSNFGTIVATDGTIPEPPTPEKCATPTISYSKGELTFFCETEGAEYVYEITDTDIKKGYAAKVSLTVTYNISVYATKADYENSDTIQATLCWIEQQPQTEGITDEDAIAEVQAVPVLIQTQGNTITVEGAEAGTEIILYGTNGVQLDSVIATTGVASLSTSGLSGSVAIVKIGNKTVKVLMKQ